MTHESWVMNHNLVVYFLYFDWCLPDGRRFFTASCGIQKKWPLGRRSLLWAKNMSHNISGSYPVNILKHHLVLTSSFEITLKDWNIMTHLTQLPSDKNPMQDSNSFQQIVHFPFSSSILLLFARQSIHLRLFPVVVLKNKSSVDILFRNWKTYIGIIFIGEYNFKSRINGWLRADIRIY